MSFVPNATCIYLNSLFLTYGTISIIRILSCIVKNVPDYCNYMTICCICQVIDLEIGVLLISFSIWFIGILLFSCLSEVFTHVHVVLIR